MCVCRIGKAHSGKVELVAVKTVFKSHPRFNEADLRRELAVLEKIDHPRCVNLVEMVEDAEAFHFVQELGAGGELFDRIVELGSFCEEDAVKLIHQLVQGVAYLHSQGIIHRDLKPENLLMKSRTPDTPEYMQLKICDFGLSAVRSIESDEEWARDLQRFAGTQEYMAPEVFLLAAKNADALEGRPTKIDKQGTVLVKPGTFLQICNILQNERSRSVLSDRT